MLKWISFLQRCGKRVPSVIVCQLNVANFCSGRRRCFQLGCRICWRLQRNTWRYHDVWYHKTMVSICHYCLCCCYQSRSAFLLFFFNLSKKKKGCPVEEGHLTFPASVCGSFAVNSSFRTFDYIERELPKVPTHLPILVLGNHRDMGHHRTVMEDTVRYFLEELSRYRKLFPVRIRYDVHIGSGTWNQRWRCLCAKRTKALGKSLSIQFPVCFKWLSRPEGSGEIKYAESSMMNGFGLKYIHRFFNLPFLTLQVGNCSFSLVWWYDYLRSSQHFGE